MLGNKIMKKFYCLNIILDSIIYLSVGSTFSTINSDLISGEMKKNNSTNNMITMNTVQQIEIIAPVVVGWVRSLGTLRYMSMRFMSKTILRIF